MKEVKCECGHINPPGTVLCESCGKPLTIENSESKGKLLDMRYDGSARRSQTYKKSIIDKVWNFFSSVKVGVWLIIITLIASAIGTIFPQEMYIPPSVPAAQYYQQEYGIFGQVYYQLGFHQLYSSWWFLILVASIGISLVICSLDRVIPLYRALKTQGVIRHDNFMKRQRLYSSSSMLQQDTLETVKTRLKQKRYRVREENGSLFAEKGRFSRWGPYVNHIGLIIFLIGVLLRSVPGMYIDNVLWVREGETVVIPGTEGEYYLKNNKFIMDVYNKEDEKDVFNDAIARVGDGSIVKNFQSNVTLFKRQGEIVHGAEPELIKETEEQIRVNEPLKFNNFALYQVDYKLNELNKMTFTLIDKQSEKEFGQLTIDLLNPAQRYDLGDGYEVELASYLPDFYFNNKEQPDTRTSIPNNPAFVFKIYAPDRLEGESSFVAIQQTIEPNDSNKYKMKFESAETKNLTALTVRKDLTLWMLGLGGAIFMIGVIQGMYWTHRRIWIKTRDHDVLLAAHTNKNWYGLKREIENIIDDTKIEIPLDQKELTN